MQSRQPLVAETSFDCPKGVKAGDVPGLGPEAAESASREHAWAAGDTLAPAKLNRFARPLVSAHYVSSRTTSTPSRSAI
jgi:hypothetical protein